MTRSIRSLFPVLVTVGVQAASGGEGRGASASPAGPQLRNPDFSEIDPGTGAPRAWRVADWSPEAQRGAVTLRTVPDDGVPGGKAAEIAYEGRGSNLVVYQEVEGTAGHDCRVSVRCKPPHGKQASVSAVNLLGSEILQYPKSTPHTGNGEWQTLELQFPVDPRSQRTRLILRTNGETRFATVSLAAEPGGIDVKQEPSNERELRETKAAAQDEATAADELRKSRMGPAELAWERVLEENLGPFYLPRYKEAKAKGSETAWDYVTDDPALPRILLIGDSISRGYTVTVRRALAGKVNVHRAPANCGPTTQGLKLLDVWLGDGAWDLVHFNFGVHDRQSDVEEYAERLEAIVERLKATGAKLVWASSTPLSSGAEGTFTPGTMVPLNEAAARVMARHGVSVNDLYSVAKPALADVQTPDGCHFNAGGYRLLGGAVAARILQELGRE